MTDSARPGASKTARSRSGSRPGRPTSPVVLRIGWTLVDTPALRVALVRWAGEDGRPDLPALIAAAFDGDSG